MTPPVSDSAHRLLSAMAFQGAGGYQDMVRRCRAEIGLADDQELTWYDIKYCMRVGIIGRHEPVTENRKT